MTGASGGTVIRAEGLGKRYRLGRREGYRTAASALSRGVRRATARTGEPRERYFWALSDVSLEVGPGEILGLIGANGAGKTTLLKILSSITEPTSGYAELHGRVGSLLEVGTGFHPELTGRENAFLNGAILGMRKAEIVRHFDEIVAFAEVERFIDTPVKFYSSGMSVRLAFAVAAFLEPEILLIDEVLAVGDADFQRRCIGKMDEVAASGRTIIFVSHNMSAIARLCTNSVRLERGKIVDSGPPRTVIEEYLTKGAQSGIRVWEPEEQGDGPFKPQSVGLLQLGEPTDSISAEEPFVVEFGFELTEEVRNLLVQVTLRTPDGVDLLTTQDRDDPELEEVLRTRPAGRYRAAFTVPGRLLNEGRFIIALNVTTRPKLRHYFTEENACLFTVYRIGGPGSHVDAPISSLLRPRLEWTVERQEAWVHPQVD